MSKKYLRLDKRPKGLTMGEFVIGLGIIAVLALILIPIFRSVNPDKNEALGKKANYIVNRIINELSTDTYLYPDNGEFSGFKNTDKVVYNGSEHAGTTKFCTLFASRIVKKPGTEVNCTPGNVSVTSSEGMDFYLPISNFDGGAQTITVDVNGAEGPNCLDKSGCSSPDRFVFKVLPGTRVPADKVGFYGPTALPPAKDMQPAAPDGPAKDSRTAQNVYSISCGSVSGATIYGQGANKVNGNYTLVAIPKKGYKCDWFIHQVTVKDADVKDCQITCSPDNNVPQSDGEVTPPPVEPDDDDTEEDDTYCISVNMTGDPEGCTISGDGCNLKPDIYTVTITVDDGYSADWTSQKVTIVDKDVSLDAVCTMEEPEECYAVTFKGDTEHCPVTLPDANCKKEEGKFRPGTYKYQVTPANGWSFKDSTKPVDQTFIVADKDQEIEIECKESTLPPVVDIYVKDTFDGLYQDEMHTSNTYYHVSAKRYYDVRTLKVEVPDVYVKLQIKGKYTGTRYFCEAYSAANCSSSGLTLNENGIEAQFRQPLKHELANDGSIRWEVIEELGEGGGTGSAKLIQSKWETFTLTINDKVYAENAAWPSSSTVLEYEDKELNTVFKLHYESPKRYMYQFTEVDMDGNRVAPAVGGAGSYAWIIAKTNVVDCAGSGGCGGGFAGSIMGDGNYTYFEPGAPHIAHEGEPIHFRIGEPFRRCSDNRIYFPVGVFKNGSQVCSAPNWSAQQWAECDITVSGGQSFPSINSLTIKLDSCQADASGYRCEDGRSFPNISNTGSGCR